PPARIAVGGGKEQQDFLAFAKFDAADLDGSGRGTEESLKWRLEAQHLLKGAADQVRIVAKSLPLLRVAREAIERVADPIDGSVDPCREERPHQHPGFVFRQLAGIDRLENL